MTDTRAGSARQVHQDTQSTHAGLSTTADRQSSVKDVAALQNVSSDRIRLEGRDHADGKEQGFFAGLSQQARENPLQAVACATVIALPALVRSGSFPLLLMGAGLALMSSRAAGGPFNQASKAARQALRSANGSAESVISQTRRALHDAQEAVGSTAADVQQTAVRLASGIRDQAAEYGNAATGSLGFDRDAVAKAAGEAIELTRAKAADAFDRSRSSIEGAVRDNVILVGGIGLAIGALIAASLPPTRSEAAVMGHASDALLDWTAGVAVDKVGDLTSAAVTSAQALAGRLVDAASDAAAKTAGELNTLTEEAIKTAIEPSPSNRR